MDTRLVHPFTSIVAGPTGCGKTTFVLSLLRHSLTLVNLQPEKITWCYREWQPLYSTLSTIHPNLECVEGLPDVSSFDSNKRNLVVIDDFMSETDERVTKLFTKKSHHCNTSVIYLVQNYFQKAKRVVPLSFDMSALLKRNALCLCLLAKVDPDLARVIINKGNKNLVKRLCECAHNILKGNVPLKKSQKGRLRGYNNDLRALVQWNTSLHEKKRILQKGGFVGALLAPLAKSLLAPLVTA